MRNHSTALMIYGEPGSDKTVFTVEKYKKLAAHFIEEGFDVTSVSYHDSIADKLEEELTQFPAILVWVNPIEQQGDRKRLDALLRRLSERGCFVSAHPDTILKIGTKEMLYNIKDEEFGSAVTLYQSFEDFKERFLKHSHSLSIKILKQYRGNGGKGVFKVDLTAMKQNKITVTEATNSDEERSMDIDDFYEFFSPYFTAGKLIEQEWNPNITNGMVRCYLSGNKVAGFGYQEINALYPKINGVFKKPGQRFYFSEQCGLFSDLKQIMESRWTKRLQEVTGIEDERLPVIWDADFFINKINTEKPAEKYSLCEINVSSVSPFPESSIPYIVNTVKARLKLA